jgi:hypothetical protein
MDFLSIRKKARERAEAKDGSPGAKPSEEAPPAPAAGVPQPSPPSPPPDVEPSPARPQKPAGAPFVERRAVRRPDPVLTEEELLEGALEERFHGLAPSSDGRFATWRPGSGPPPVEPDHRGWVPPTEGRRPGELAPGVDDGPVAPEPAPPSGAQPERGADWSDRGLGEARRGGERAAAHADPLDVFFYRPDEEAAVVPVLGGGAMEEAALQPPESLDEFLTFLLGKE